MKLLITGSWKYDSQDIAMIEKLGFQCFFHKNESDPLPKDYFDVDGVIFFGAAYTCATV